MNTIRDYRRDLLLSLTVLVACVGMALGLEDVTDPQQQQFSPAVKPVVSSTMRNLLTWTSSYDPTDQSVEVKAYGVALDALFKLADSSLQQCALGTAHPPISPADIAAADAVRRTMLAALDSEQELLLHKQHLDVGNLWYQLLLIDAAACSGHGDPPEDPPEDPPPGGGDPPSTPPEVPVSGDWTPPSGPADYISWTNRAAAGEIIELSGAVPHIKMDRADAATLASPVLVRGNGVLVQRNSAGGSESLNLTRAGNHHFFGVDFEADDRAVVMCGYPWKQTPAMASYSNLHFYGCEFSRNGYDFKTDTGFRGKWGILGNGLAEFALVDCKISGVFDEHCNYNHNNQGNLYYVACEFGPSKRTGTQQVARKGEGPAGIGDIYIVGCVYTDNCLEDAGGGSAMTFRGGQPTSNVFILGTQVYQGADPSLHPRYQGNITAALVMDIGSNSWPGGYASLTIDSCHFQRGPYFLGTGSARRASEISEVGTLSITRTSMWTWVGSSSMLHIKPNSIDEITLDRANDIRGTLEWGGTTFKDADKDGDGLYDGDAYRALLASLVGDPKVTIIDTAAGDPPPVGSTFDPTKLSELWAWTWAGDRGQHVDLVAGSNGEIQLLHDLSGHGRDWTTFGAKPGYQLGLTLPHPWRATKGPAWSTSLPLISIDGYTQPGGGGTDHFSNGYGWPASLNAAGEFYVAVACLNTRNNGTRELLGQDGHNLLRFDQSADSAELVLAGQRRTLAPAGTLPQGPMVLELWRDAGDVVTLQANGAVLGTATIAGSFDVSGVGWDRSGSSQWDDYAMEFVVCDGLPGSAERDDVRELLADRWEIP